MEDAQLVAPPLPLLIGSNLLWPVWTISKTVVEVVLQNLLDCCSKALPRLCQLDVAQTEVHLSRQTLWQLGRISQGWSGCLFPLLLKFEFRSPTQSLFTTFGVKFLLIGLVWMAAGWSLRHSRV